MACYAITCQGFDARLLYIATAARERIAGIDGVVVLSIAIREHFHFEESLGWVICYLCQSGVEVNSKNLINNYFRALPYYLRGAALKAVYKQF